MRYALSWGLVSLAAACASAPRARIDPPQFDELRSWTLESSSERTPVADVATRSIAATARDVAPLEPSTASLEVAARDHTLSHANAKAPAAADEDRPDASYTAISLGAFVPAGDLSEFDTGFWGDIAFGRRFAHFFGIEAAIGYYNTSGPSGADVYGVPLTLEGRFGLPVLILEPYIGVGGGGIWVHSSLDGFGSEDDFTGLFDGFIGLEVGIGDLSLGAEYKYVVSGDVDAPVGGDFNLEGNVISLTGKLPF